MLKIKICGITNESDAHAAIEYGADALGFVFYAKSPRSVDQERAKEIIVSLPPGITTVGVFVDEQQDRIKEIVSLVGLDVIQFHGSESAEDCNIYDKVYKAIRIQDLSDLDQLAKYNVLAYLLDTYSPDEHGGTGKTFNWDIAVEAKKYGNIILAGGLNPDNIEAAIKHVKPYGIDVSSGVEGKIEGIKDHSKLKLFIERARKASE
jgi:phosphoribosylanthranilate isomerase